MFGSAILELAISLAFVYLLLSLISSAVMELFAQWKGLRGKNLEAGIKNLISNDDLREKFNSHPLIRSLCRPKKDESGWHYPSYIPSRTFALTLLNVALPSGSNGTTADETILNVDDLKTRIAGITDPELKKIFTAFLVDSEHKVEAFKKNLEGWFDNTMDRVSGWYKKNTNKILVVVSAVVTCVMNVDTLALANAFYTNPALRESIVAAAEARVAEGEQTQAEAASPADATETDEAAETDETASPTEAIKSAKQELMDLKIPIGWSGDSWKEIVGAQKDATQQALALAIGTKFVGLLITTVAISFGAPVWFQILSKLVSLRASGGKAVTTAAAAASGTKKEP